MKDTLNSIIVMLSQDLSYLQQEYILYAAVLVSKKYTNQNLSLKKEAFYSAFILFHAEYNSAWR